jgi:hypothetical protein
MTKFEEAAEEAEMKMKKIITINFAIGLIIHTLGQHALVNTVNSPDAKLSGIGLSDVQWIKGFWAERFAVCRDSMVPQLWKIYHDAELCHSFRNFEIAAGLETGEFKGPSFHDGDFY